ncbi:hypothetical protein BDK51DRAFT_52654 [Blyttiomyces helicus]|uniref:Uncharacterized protein n=1 Tax=Blyttiomyces helicus TaxID=388810 RepID=A0A4P9VZX7_9FUNG|nr:hypothetical protein BDK51DRAFT_52654 [Blyttiomyces helicus]|eukprot:RKO85354.1 hypothetical protein BDK51DRAFT_52654 [Blyttiomyces helicus]
MVEERRARLADASIVCGAFAQATASIFFHVSQNKYQRQAENPLSPASSAILAPSRFVPHMTGGRNCAVQALQIMSNVYLLILGSHEGDGGCGVVSNLELTSDLRSPLPPDLTRFYFRLHALVQRPGPSGSARVDPARLSLMGRRSESIRAESVAPFFLIFPSYLSSPDPYELSHCFLCASTSPSSLLSPSFPPLPPDIGRSHTDGAIMLEPTIDDFRQQLHLQHSVRPSVDRSYSTATDEDLSVLRQLDIAAVDTNSLHQCFRDSAEPITAAVVILTVPCSRYPLKEAPLFSSLPVLLSVRPFP